MRSSTKNICSEHLESADGKVGWKGGQRPSLLLVPFGKVEEDRRRAESCKRG